MLIFLKMEKEKSERRSSRAIPISHMFAPTILIPMGTRVRTSWQKIAK